MNFYEHHIGDYSRKTAHLSLTEHGAYLLMLQTFYATEKPLPADPKLLYRLVRADSKPEKAAVDTIVKAFWVKTEEGLVNGRASEVLKVYRAWVESQRAKGKTGAHARWHSSGNGNGHSTGDGNGHSTGDASANGPAMASHSPLPTKTYQEIPTPTLPAEQEGGALQANGSTPRARGTNPRAMGSNPRAMGSNPRSSRDERKSGWAEARKVWSELIATGGAKRDHRTQAALDAIGGWQRVRMREEGEDSKLCREFCDAYVETHA